MKVTKILLLFSIICLYNSQNALNPIEEYVDLQLDQTENKDNQQIKIGYKLNHIDSQLVDIIWCNKNNIDDIVLVLTEKGSVYRSNDKGMSWNKKTEEFMQLAYMELEDNELTGVVQTLIQSPIDSSLIIFGGSHGINWKSPDCGETIIAMNQGRPISDFQFHPTIREHLLAVAWSKCEDNKDEPCALQKELYFTPNLGETWDFVKDYVVQFQWAYLDHSIKGIIPENRIIIAHQPKGKGHQNITQWSKDVVISYSDNFFKTQKEILKQGNKFLLNKQFFYAVQLQNENKQNIKLMVSNNYFNYEFKQVEFPFGQLKHKSYTILESESNSVFVNVNHKGDYSKFGNLYISDDKGSKFSLAVANNARNEEGTCDFEKILSLDGIYLANYYDQSIISKQKKKNNKFDLNSYKRTKISFNNGAVWKLVPAPSEDSRKQKIKCLLQKDCSLHLHTVTNNDMYGSFYSTQKAIGIVIATGNTGKYLSRQKGDVNTYLSRDGGRNWNEIMKGSYIYEIGDHGGLLLMASDEEPTNTLFYSWNEGDSWHSFTFSQQKITVTNIITEPTNSALSFILYGKDPNDQGVMISLDFQQFHKYQCKGLDIPDHDQSDYELWNVKGTDKSECLLGKKETIVRKKISSMCYNGQQFEKKMFQELCKCSDADYECDIGYSREENGPCKLTNSTKLNDQELLQYFWDVDPSQPSKIIQNCTDFYYISSGYRKIPGDVCKGGVVYEPVKIPCPKAIKETLNIKQQLKYKRLVTGSLIIAIIMLIIYMKSDILLNNTKIVVQNINFLINRKNFDYSKFDNDEEVDFSKMVFDEDNNEFNNENDAKIVDENKLI